MLAEGTAVELLPIAMRVALAEPVVYEEMPATTAVGFLLYVQPPAWMRRVTAVDGLDELRADPRVKEVILNRGPGQSVGWREGNHGHVFSVRGAVADHEQLKLFEQRVHAETQIHGD